MKNESNKTKKGKNDDGFKEENPIKGIERIIPKGLNICVT